MKQGECSVTVGVRVGSARYGGAEPHLQEQSGRFSAERDKEAVSQGGRGRRVFGAEEAECKNVRDNMLYLRN